MIDQIARTLEVLRLEAGRWTIIVTYAGDAAVRAESFDATSFNLGEFWAD